MNAAHCGRLHRGLSAVSEGSATSAIPVRYNGVHPPLNFSESQFCCHYCHTNCSSCNKLLCSINEYFCSLCVFLGPRQLSRHSDSLRAGRFGDRIEVGMRFSAPAQTGPRAHPASHTMGIGSFPGVKRPRNGIDHLTHLARRLKIR